MKLSEDERLKSQKTLTSTPSALKDSNISSRSEKSSSSILEEIKKESLQKIEM